MIKGGVRKNKININIKIEKKMTTNEIKALFEGNEEAYKDFQAKFNTSPDVIVMKQKIANLQRAFQYVQAMQLQKKLNEVEYKVAKELIDEQKSNKINQ